MSAKKAIRFCPYFNKMSIKKLNKSGPFEIFFLTLVAASNTNLIFTGLFSLSYTYTESRDIHLKTTSNKYNLTLASQFPVLCNDPEPLARTISRIISLLEFLISIVCKKKYYVKSSYFVNRRPSNLY